MAKNKFSVALYPLSMLYGMGVKMRNALYNLQVKKSVEFDLPVISIGNLSAGGTGKTPHTEYLLKLLSPQFDCGVLSRGYGRKTKGYVEVGTDSDFSLVGDEPLQVKKKFNNVLVAVCEERVIGIPIMLIDRPGLKVIILDDAFQHRTVKPGLSILLTDYSNLFTKDHLLPMGTLREQKTNASRADVIVITKCPHDITDAEADDLRNEVRTAPQQQIFLSALRYAKPYSIFSPEKTIELSRIEQAGLITGIAASQPIFNYLQLFIPGLQHRKFFDHYPFTLNDIKATIKLFEQNGRGKPVLFTTEKDAVRLLKFRGYFNSINQDVFCIPIEISFNGNEKEKFDSIVLDFVNQKLKEKTT